MPTTIFAILFRDHYTISLQCPNKFEPLAIEILAVDTKCHNSNFVAIRNNNKYFEFLENSSVFYSELLKNETKIGVLKKVGKPITLELNGNFIKYCVYLRDEQQQNMDADQILEKCGSFGRYQLVMFGLFGVINMLSSIHYYSQTIINFVPDHW